MVEVFKTDVQDEVMASELLALIHGQYEFYKANFDLQDCDKVLRIQTEEPNVCAEKIIAILKLNGFNAELLPDESF